MKPEILTFNGRYFNFLEPQACHIDIETIAHALAHICRFTGHTNQFYSVAQHSVLVSHLVPPQHALAGLLHDAAEAFLGDVATPLKQLLPDYKAIEARVEGVVLEHFGLGPMLPPEVRHADLCALMTEARDFMPAEAEDWDFGPTVQPHALTIFPMSSGMARQQFMQRFRVLTTRRHVTDWSAA